MARKLLHRVKKRVKLETLTFLFLFIIVIPLGLTLIFLFFPLFIYRYLVTRLARLFRPKLTHVVTGGSSWFALEKVTEKARTNIVCCVLLRGQITDRLDSIRSMYDRAVVNKRREVSNQGGGKPAKGELVYPELQQTWASFMGYNFWTNETNFDIRDHIRVLDTRRDGEKSAVFTRSDLHDLTSKLLSSPWRDDFSPWEVLLVPNFVEDEREGNEERAGDENSHGKSVLIVRFHHVLGDGKTWMHLAFRDGLGFTDPLFPKEVLSKTYRKPSPCAVALWPIKVLYDGAKNFVGSIDTTDPSLNPWHAPGKRCREYHLCVSSSRPVDYIKKLKSKFGVSYAAVLVSAISGGIRRLMIEAGQHVPKKMGAAMVVPMPRHPGGIVVHAAGINVRWPTGVGDPLERLAQFHQEVRRNRRSLVPLGVYWTMQVSGIFPNFVRRTVYNKLQGTLAATLFPGPMTWPQLEGCVAYDAFLAIGHYPGQLGAVVSSFVLGGRQRIGVTIDKTLFPPHLEFQRLGQLIDEEFEALEKCSHESFLGKMNNRKINIV